MSQRDSVAEMRPDLEKLSSEDLTRIAGHLRAVYQSHAKNDSQRSIVSTTSDFLLMIKDILDKRSQSVQD